MERKELEEWEQIVLEYGMFDEGDVVPEDQWEGESEEVPL